MRWPVLIFLLFIATQVFCQFGVRTYYEINRTSRWQEVIDAEGLQPGLHLFDNSFALSVDYWLRLKNVRIELLPEALYTSHNAIFNLQAEKRQYRMKTMGLGLNVQIYPLDLYGDCDCPTFSKQGSFFTKGFFLYGRPGFEWHRQQLEFGTPGRSQWTSGPSFAIGSGLDIGITDLITITPLVSYKLNPAIRWDGFSMAHNQTTGDNHSDRSTLSIWQFGLRIGFRADYQD